MRKDPINPKSIYESPQRMKFYIYLCEYFKENYHLPTDREVVDEGVYSSTSVVAYNYRLLERDGFLQSFPSGERKRRYTLTNITLILPPAYEYFQHILEGKHE